MTNVIVPSGAQTASEIEGDWRFAELVACSWIDSDLVVRYREDPCSVLAKFRLRVSTEAQAPALPTDSGEQLLIEDLTHSSSIVLPSGFCNAGFAVEDAADPVEI